jgi:hypothetical protein
MSSMDSYDDPQPRVRPTMLTVICVLGIVFGALGLLSGGFGLLSQLFSSQIQQAVTAGQPEISGPAAGAQAEIVTRTMDISRKYNPVLIPLTVVKILVEGALLIGSIMTLGLKLSGKSMLAGALIAAAILESILFVPKTMMQRETQVALADLMPQVMSAQQGANGMPSGFDMSSMMNGIGTVTLVFGIFWLALKIVLYVLGTKYLRRPDIEALFTSTSQEVR